MTSVAWPSDPAGTAASYERVSRHEQSLYGYGLKRTTRTVDEIARELGVHLPDELRFRDGVDSDASGARRDLEGLERVMDLARRGRYKTLIVSASDRWTRDTPKGLAFTQQVRSYGVNVVWGDLPNMPAADADDPHAYHWRQKIETEAFMDAEYERAKIRWRTMNGRRDKAAGGRVVGNGAPPYGYEYVRDSSPKRLVCGLQPVDAEADVVRELYQRALRSSLGQLLLWLQAEGVLPPGGRRTYKQGKVTAWTGHTLYDILTNRLYVGEWAYKGQALEVPCIVSAELQEDVRAAFASRQGRRGAARLHTDDDEFLFRGRLTCGPCTEREGRPVLFQSKRANSKGERYYVCPRHWHHQSIRAPKVDSVPCDLPTIRAEVLEQQVWDAIIGACLDPARLQAELADARTRRRRDDAGREDRKAAISTSINRQERLLAVHVNRLAVLEAEATPEAREEIPIHVEARDTARRLLVGLRRELKAVEESPGPGISEAESAAIERLAADIRLAGEVATASQRRSAIVLLNLRAIVGQQGEPIVIQSKSKRTVQMLWTGALPIQASSDSDVSFLNYTLELLHTRLVFSGG